MVKYKGEMRGKKRKGNKMRRMSKEERREAFMSRAGTLFEEMEAWYEAHPEATFGEIEAELRQQRRQLMGETQAVLINGRDTGYQREAPECGACGQRMTFERYVKRKVSGLEGDVQLERAYYRCPQGCGESLFPPRPETEAAPGQLE